MSLGNGIKISSGFDLGSKSPLDGKAQFQTLTERDSISVDIIPEGQWCYIISTKENYQFIDGAWVLREFGKGVGTTVDWNNVVNKPSEYTPSNHSHNYNDLIDKPTIPTKVSQLENDLEFITKSYFDEIVAKLIERIDYLETIINSGGVQYDSLVDIENNVLSDIDGNILVCKSVSGTQYYELLDINSNNLVDISQNTLMSK